MARFRKKLDVNNNGSNFCKPYLLKQEEEEKEEEYVKQKKKKKKKKKKESNLMCYAQLTSTVISGQIMRINN